MHIKLSNRLVCKQSINQPLLKVRQCALINSNSIFCSKKNGVVLSDSIKGEKGGGMLCVCVHVESAGVPAPKWRTVIA